MAFTMQPYIDAVKPSTNTTLATATSPVTAAYPYGTGVPISPMRAPSMLPNHGGAEGTLGAISSMNIDLYNNIYRPFNRQILSTIGSAPNERNAQGMVGSEARATMLGDAEAIAARNAKRFGLARGAADTAHTRKMADLGFGTYRASTMDKARRADYDRDQTVSDAMANYGRGLETLSMKNLTNAAQSESNIESANASIEAQNDAARWQTGASLATLALMAYFM